MSVTITPEIIERSVRADKILEASDLIYQRNRILKIKAHLDEQGEAVRISFPGMGDSISWVLLDGNPSSELELDEHPRIVATLRAHIEARVAEIDEKLHALGVTP